MIIKKHCFPLILMLSLILVSPSCKETETTEETEVTASFTTDKDSGDSPLTIKFTNTSKNAAESLWDFGDGSNSTDKDPTHTFVNTSTTSEAKITVTLTSTGSDNSTATKTKIITVNKSANETNGATTALFNENLTYGTMTDLDGNIYKTITIGTQTWMAENLRTTKYNDGTDIAKVQDNTTWSGLSSGAYCNHKNITQPDSIATFGRLYNWYAVASGKLAPAGWRVPGDSDWDALFTYLGGQSVAGGKMKETGTSHWLSPNTSATNESGFTAIPSGARMSLNAKFSTLGGNAYYWTSTAADASYAYFWYLTFNQTSSDHSAEIKQVGCAVRCIKN